MTSWRLGCSGWANFIEGRRTRPAEAEGNVPWAKILAFSTVAWPKSRSPTTTCSEREGTTTEVGSTADRRPRLKFERVVERDGAAWRQRLGTRSEAAQGKTGAGSFDLDKDVSRCYDMPTVSYTREQGEADGSACDVHADQVLCGKRAKDEIGKGRNGGMGTDATEEGEKKKKDKNKGCGTALLPHRRPGIPDGNVCFGGERR